MKKIWIVLGMIGIVLVGAYLLLSLNLKNDKTIASPPPISVPIVVEEDEASMASASEESESERQTTTTGNDKFTKVTVGDSSSKDLMTIRRHTYSVVNSIEDLEKLENTITYVLLPRNISGQTNPDRAMYKRYVQVLELIQELQQVDKSINKVSPMTAQQENQFILFRDRDQSAKVSVENYDYALSHKVLDFFQEKYPDMAFSQEGPYLITTARNVLMQPKDFSCLYVNLCSFANSSVKEVIESYKQRLINKGGSDVTLLEGWRFNLLSALTNLNADIQIVQTAMAGEL